MTPTSTRGAKSSAGEHATPIRPLAEADYIAIAPDLLSGTGRGGVVTESLPGRDAVTRAVRDLPRR